MATTSGHRSRLTQELGAGHFAGRENVSRYQVVLEFQPLKRQPFRAQGHRALQAWTCEVEPLAVVGLRALGDMIEEPRPHRPLADVEEPGLLPIS